MNVNVNVNGTDTTRNERAQKAGTKLKRQAKSTNSGANEATTMEIISHHEAFISKAHRI